jgi:hypothetical protein
VIVSLSHKAHKHVSTFRPKPQTRPTLAGFYIVICVFGLKFERPCGAGWGAGIAFLKNWIPDLYRPAHIQLTPKKTLDSFHFILLPCAASQFSSHGSQSLTKIHHFCSPLSLLSVHCSAEH